jgi:hypothetical protein
LHGTAVPALPTRKTKQEFKRNPDYTKKLTVLWDAIKALANFAEHASQSHLVDGVALSIGKDVLILVVEA